MYKSVQRLRLTKSDRILVLHAPKSFTEFEQYFTAGIDREIKGRAYPSVFYFTDNLEHAVLEIPRVLRAAAYDALFWFGFPKKQTHDAQPAITREQVQRLFEPHGLEPVAQRTIDEHWTALRMRPKELVKHRRSSNE